MTWFYQIRQVFFFERNNICSLADAINRWFEVHQERRQEVREACYSIIDNYWNPDYQINVIFEALETIK